MKIHIHSAAPSLLSCCDVAYAERKTIQREISTILSHFALEHLTDTDDMRAKTSLVQVFLNKSPPFPVLHRKITVPFLLTGSECCRSLQGGCTKPKRHARQSTGMWKKIFFCNLSYTCFFTHLSIISTSYEFPGNVHSLRARGDLINQDHCTCKGCYSWARDCACSFNSD